MNGFTISSEIVFFTLSNIPFPVSVIYGILGTYMLGLLRPDAELYTWKATEEREACIKQQKHESTTYLPSPSGHLPWPPPPGPVINSQSTLSSLSPCLSPHPAPSLTMIILTLQAYGRKAFLHSWEVPLPGHSQRSFGLLGIVTGMMPISGSPWCPLKVQAEPRHGQVLIGDLGKMQRDLSVAGCVHYFSGCYDKMSDIYQLKEEILGWERWLSG